MATNTPNLLLRKPDPTDLASVLTDLNDNLDKIDAETLFWMKNIPRARIIRTTTYSCNPNVNVQIPFTAGDYDYGGCWNPATPTRLTAPIAGYYLCQACISFDINTTGVIRNIHILRSVDGAQVANGTFPQSSTGWHAGGTVIGETYLTAGQYIETNVYHNASTAINVRGDSYVLSMTMRMTGR